MTLIKAAALPSHLTLPRRSNADDKQQGMIFVVTKRKAAVMGDRSTRALLIAILLVLGFIAVQPFVERQLYSATTPRPIEPRGTLAEFERTATEIFDRISPSVVHVAILANARELSLSPRPDVKVAVADGTGFVWDAAGHIVTNNHVVEGGKSIGVRFASGESLAAKVVGRAPHYDLAVIHVSEARKLPPPVPLGDYSDLRVGQAAFAIGNPFGLDRSLTTGTISALSRRLPTSAGREVANVIQTDAAINPGNSGGPLLDSAGRLIGVNTAIYSPSGAYAGIGFAIPVDVVNRIVPQLIRDGRVPTPGIGIIPGDEVARDPARRRRGDRRAHGAGIAGRTRGTARDQPHDRRIGRYHRCRERQARTPARGTQRSCRADRRGKNRPAHAQPPRQPRHRHGRDRGCDPLPSRNLTFVNAGAIMLIEDGMGFPHGALTMTKASIFQYSVAPAAVGSAG